MGKYDRVDTMCPIARDIDLKGILEYADSAKIIIGDETAGLVHDVAAIQGVIGDASSGMIKSVGDLELAVFSAPAAGTALLSGDKKTVTIPLDVPSLRNVVDEPLFKASFTISTDGENYAALGENDSISFMAIGKFIIVTFETALSTATNTIKIAAGALISIGGAENDEIITNNLDATGA
jgi:hypothetical protein